MINAKKISRNLFNIYALFTREPFVQYFAEEIEYYSDENGVLGIIILDITDQDYSSIILSRDSSKQYKAETIEVSIPTIDEARKWIDNKLSSDRLIFHEPTGKFFDIFKIIVSSDKRHPFFDYLNEYVGLLAAKEVIKEISYHYKDIDGNFVQQFQSLNGFDARLWELYLFCLCREEYFQFNRNSYAPDFMVEKEGTEIAIEAVTINRSINTREAIVQDSTPSNREEIEKKLQYEMPAKYANALVKKLNKLYWTLSHVAGKPLVFAIADFHAFMSMTWSFEALLEYLFGYRPSFTQDKEGKTTFIFKEIEGFIKPSGAIMPAGFFNIPDSENVSAILFSATATLSKFNRMGKQAGLGSEKSNLVRTGICHNPDPNSPYPLQFTYKVDENSKETWAEGVSIFHNPKALIPIDSQLFPSCAHHFLVDGRIKSIFPEFFPYGSLTSNLVTTDI